MISSILNSTYFLLFWFSIGCQHQQAKNLQLVVLYCYTCKFVGDKRIMISNAAPNTPVSSRVTDKKLIGSSQGRRPSTKHYGGWFHFFGFTIHNHCFGKSYTVPIFGLQTNLTVLLLFKRLVIDVVRFSSRMKKCHRARAGLPSRVWRVMSWGTGKNEVEKWNGEIYSLIHFIFIRLIWWMNKMDE